MSSHPVRNTCFAFARVRCTSPQVRSVEDQDKHCPTKSVTLQNSLCACGTFVFRKRLQIEDRGVVKLRLHRAEG